MRVRQNRARIVAMRVIGLALSIIVPSYGVALGHLRDPNEFEALSSDQLDRAINAIHDSSNAKVELFYLPTVESPVQRPTNSVEVAPAWHCVITDRGTVDKLIAAMSNLKLATTNGDGLDPALELRFFRADHLVMKATFTDGGRRDVRGNAVTPGLINGRIGLFYYEGVKELIEFVRHRLTGC